MEKRWTKEQEEEARLEYESFMKAIENTNEFEGSWKGFWEDKVKSSFGRNNTVVVKGDRDTYMKHWLANQELIKNDKWFIIENEEDYYDGNF